MNKIKLPRKNLIPFDDNDCYLIVGFTHKQTKEALAYEHKVSGDDGLTKDDLDPVWVYRGKVDGEDYYNWSGDCSHCGTKFKNTFPAFLIRY